MNACDRPLAGPGLISYRYKGPCGWIMIGAKTHAHALAEANRSLSKGGAELAWLDVWNGREYVPAMYCREGREA